MPAASTATTWVICSSRSRSWNNTAGILGGVALWDDQHLAV